MLIFERSRAGCYAYAQAPQVASVTTDIPSSLLRQQPPLLPEVSELEVVRHYTSLSQKNFSIDTQFYPLGSCTMKYNPRAAHRVASLTAALQRHPLADNFHSQGVLQCLYELQQYLTEITGMHAVALSPMAGAQGEFTGIAMIRAYHEQRDDDQRTEIIVPDSAHGTNPASAVMCGYTIKEVVTGANGEIDLDALRAAASEKTAGIMLTNPSTLGVFETHITAVAKIIHDVGGLLYYDGANLNAILARVRPGDMGFDVMHMNLHKTFATPHGGGGPGSGPVAANARLAPYLPTPRVQFAGDQYRWAGDAEYPDSIGRLSTFMGNVGILLRAYAYIRLLGRSGLAEVSEYATLNANYLMARLRAVGFTTPFSSKRASHEFLLTLKPQADQFQVSAMDFAKRLLDYQFHAPTVYFPLSVAEAMLIEPTETESKQTLDAFVDVMQAILQEAETDSVTVQTAPHNLSVRRLDDVKAAKLLDLRYYACDTPA